MSNIEWTDETWNPTVGCMKVSAGCEQCYAITTAYRLENAFKQPAYAGLTRKLPDGSINWTGKVRELPERLSIPLKWNKPRRVFVDSMSDLFHDDVSDEFIDQCFGMMAMASQHVFQVLTKRPERMLASAQRLHQRFEDDTPYLQAVGIPGTARTWTDVWWASGATDEFRWPLPNVWLGTSVEDQRAADERIPLLLQTPAAVRFLSCEPLIGSVDIRHWLHYVPCPQHPGEVAHGWGHLECDCRPFQSKRGDGISWVIAGGESGAKHRPMDLDWARSLRDQCADAGVAFFFKQHGGRTHASGGCLLDGHEHKAFPYAVIR